MRALSAGRSLVGATGGCAMLYLCLCSATVRSDRDGVVLHILLNTCSWFEGPFLPASCLGVSTFMLCLNNSHQLQHHHQSAIHRKQHHTNPRLSPTTHLQVSHSPRPPRAC
ncbi:hypothetical protein M440DRAFT_1208942 [Trichoderma longibrachiatum ATCC 18648]|uniref:Uncharacterized protein n=1 Tax=Trichoderma longibrachiatum ATCC 18648 TaxID=983965 RepID=A0A2T4C6V5_TRILO|nr:hypothetical protein M440DRAFT_1208942 [Trichoderma longibrachiatum ATCC 18648]